jgi:hypothetical protein
VPGIHSAERDSLLYSPSKPRRLAQGRVDAVLPAGAVFLEMREHSALSSRIETISLPSGTAVALVAAAGSTGLVVAALKAASARSNVLPVRRVVFIESVL